MFFNFVLGIAQPEALDPVLFSRVMPLAHPRSNRAGRSESNYQLSLERERRENVSEKKSSARGSPKFTVHRLIARVLAVLEQSCDLLLGKLSQLDDPIAQIQIHFH